MKQYQIDRIKDLMDAKGVTTKELASMCGYSEMTIRRILTPNHNPTTDTVEKIAETLGVHEQYIYEAEIESKAKMPIPQVEAEICYESLPTELKKVVSDFYVFLESEKI